MKVSICPNFLVLPKPDVFPLPLFLLLAPLDEVDEAPLAARMESSPLSELLVHLAIFRVVVVVVVIEVVVVFFMLVVGVTDDV